METLPTEADFALVRYYNPIPVFSILATILLALDKNVSRQCRDNALFMAVLELSPLGTMRSRLLNKLQGGL